jgi:hypothetical protein
MRIKLATPIPGPFEAATYISVDNARLVRRNVLCTVAYWTDSGRKLDERDEPLSEADYAEWCETDADSDDEVFLANAFLAAKGLEAAPPPPPPEPPPPETEEERIAREAEEKAATLAAVESEVAALKAQLADAEARFAELKG